MLLSFIFRYLRICSCKSSKGEQFLTLLLLRSPTSEEGLDSGRKELLLLQREIHRRGA